jgi:hypothetical protein
MGPLAHSYLLALFLLLQLMQQWDLKKKRRHANMTKRYQGEKSYYYLLHPNLQET